MTLRHPGYIAYVVPYEGFGHHRATLFFGVPCQNYFYKAMEAGNAYKLGQMGLNTSNPMIGNAHYAILNPADQTAALTMLNSRLKPFCNYFHIDSEHHIIDNGIITSARDTFNAVEVAYVDDATQAFPDTYGGAPDPSAFYTTFTKPVKCNEAVREDYCRWFSTRERNCEGSLWAERCAQSYLSRCLKDLYQGEIVITGEPAMKPYDQVFVFDSYNDMFGPIEVEQVVHIFSAETGFVTVITPDLAEGDLLCKRPEKSRLTPKSGPFSMNFSFYNLPSSLSFFGKTRGF
jgi:hypothetical protein